MYSCKMCGVGLERKKGVSMEKCPYCGMINTVPKPGNMWQENWFDKANFYRRQHDYARAIDLYNRIIADDELQAQAYWEKFLCKYGVEYISDLSTGACVPVCNLIRNTVVFEDEDYKAALRYSEPELQKVYEKEAKELVMLQQQLRAVAENEDDYDIYICYREKDQDKNPTKDAEVAEELYQYLRGNGFDVYLDAECKTQHSDTKAYRLRALSQATVMLAVGVGRESFEDPEVYSQCRLWQEERGEDADKTLILAYRDMDRYQIPDDFMHLRAKDMNKLSFMQNLLSELKLLCESKEEKKEEEKDKEESPQGNISAESLTERAMLCLEDSEFDKADELLELALNSKAKYAPAYAGKLMVKLRCTAEADLMDNKIPLEQYKEYNRILRFGDEAIRNRFEEYNRQIIQRNTTVEQSAKELLYNRAKNMMDKSENEQEYLDAARVFNELGEFENAKDMYSQCMQLAAQENLYQEACRLLHNNSYDEAENRFVRLGDYRDAAQMAGNCQKEKQFQQGLSLLGNRQYDEAAKVFEDLGEYKNATEQVKRCKERVDRETLVAQKNEKKSALQAKKEEIKRQIREQGVFDGKRTRELYGQLDEVEDQIRDLNNEQIYIDAATTTNEQEEIPEEDVSPKDALLMKKEKIKREIEQQGMFDGRRRKELFSQLDDIEDRIRELNEATMIPAKPIDTAHQMKNASKEKTNPAENKEKPVSQSEPQENRELDKEELMEELRRKKEAIKAEIEQQGLFAGKRIKQLYDELDHVEDKIKDIHVELSPFMEKKEEVDIFYRPLEELNKDELRQRKEEVKKEIEDFDGVFDAKYRKQLYDELDEIEERLKAFLEQ